MKLNRLRNFEGKKESGELFLKAVKNVKSCVIDYEGGERT